MKINPLFTLGLALTIAAFPRLSVRSAEPSHQLHYRMDPKDSEFMVFTGTAGVFKAFGHKHKISIPDFSGEVDFDPQDLSRTHLHLKVDPNSLFVVPDSKGERKDKPEIEQAMREKVLEVAKFPEIDFNSTAVSTSAVGPDQYQAKIQGNLTLHGVTLSLPIEAKVTLGPDRLTAEGEFSLKQTDYQIKPVSAGGGTVKVKDEIRLHFRIVGHS